MHIESIEIDGIGGIDKLSLNFDRHMNIICGPNGIGKTTILNAITHIGAELTPNLASLKRNVLKEKGRVSFVFNINNEPIPYSYETASFHPFDATYSTINYFDKSKIVKHILSINATRSFNYTAVDAIKKDPPVNLNSLLVSMQIGISIEDSKNWFINRQLYGNTKNSDLSVREAKNLEFAEKCFSIIDKSIEFDRLVSRSNDILVKTPTGSIYYEYLSSGYKSLITILFSIIKEVEYRFADQEMLAKDFDGVILIDELEIHLHPEWQTKILGILREAFPQAQFIVTTHSPHIIQSAESNEIIALERVGDNVQRREIKETQNGFKYWTLDEVLTDIMGMQDTNTKEFNELLDKFNQAIDNEDGEKAREIFATLDASLHPQNYLRKMLKLDMAGLR